MKTQAFSHNSYGPPNQSIFVAPTPINPYSSNPTQTVSHTAHSYSLHPQTVYQQQQQPHLPAKSHTIQKNLLD